MTESAAAPTPPDPRAELVAANEAFYKAFESLKLDRMDDLWARGDDVVCIHPGWRILRGWEHVHGSWQMIFANTESMQFLLTDVHAECGEAMGWVSCMENIIQTSGEEPFYYTVQATNIFRRVEGRWKVVLHHASGIVAEWKGPRAKGKPDEKGQPGEAKG